MGQRKVSFIFVILHIDLPEKRVHCQCVFLLLFGTQNTILQNYEKLNFKNFVLSWVAGLPAKPFFL